MIGSYGHYGYGAELPPVELGTATQPIAEDPSIVQLVAGYMPVAQALAEQLKDKYRVVLDLRNKVALAKSQGQSSAYIASLEAKLAAAERAYQKQLEGESSVQQYRMLGQIGLVTAIGVGASVIFYVFTRALR